MKEFNAHEFGSFINSIKADIHQIEKGSQVFNGMMHKDRVVAEFNQIVRVLEKQSELMTKLVVEYEANKHYIELGKAIKEAFENGYSLDAYEFDECDDIKIVDSISRVDDLLKWAEGRE